MAKRSTTPKSIVETPEVSTPSVIVPPEEVANIAILRARYRAAKLILANYLSNEEFTKLMTEQLGDIHEDGTMFTPAEHAHAIEHITIPCVKCSGTGQFSWGHVLNGTAANQGKCFRCAGKGHLTISDLKRNYGYDNFAPPPVEYAS